MQVNVINFTVTHMGLVEQLLALVVRRERPELEEQMDRLVVSISNDRRQLKVDAAATALRRALFFAPSVRWCLSIGAAAVMLRLLASFHRCVLQELEDKILKMLEDSTGNILDDEVLINTLNTSKLTSAVIKGRVREAEQAERELSASRNGFRSVRLMLQSLS